MEWTDDAIVLGARRHGEANAVAELMTRGHGRHLGLVRGGSGSRHKPVLQAGNWSMPPGGRGSTSISVIMRSKVSIWRAASYLGCAHALYGSSISRRCAGCCRNAIRTGTSSTCSTRRRRAELASPGTAAARVARFELRLLAELGFGLDLAACAATGAHAPISPMCRRKAAARSRAPPASRGMTSSWCCLHSCSIPAWASRRRRPCAMVLR